VIEELHFPNGSRLVQRWQANERDAKDRLREIFDATIAGEYDDVFRHPAPQDRVHVSASLNLLTLAMMHDLYQLNSVDFYKGDAQRYVRTTLMSRRLLGIDKMYLSWPVYAFSAEAMGAKMMYQSSFPPGAEPDKALVTADNWRDIRTPDFDSGIPKLIEEMLACYQRLTGFQPVLHVSAPYSLAADIIGQEPLLDALSHAPQFVNEFLDLLVDRVLAPWADAFFQRFPRGWLEFSDASGSPLFIGPTHFQAIAHRTVARIISENSWGRRVYCANYRGDYVAETRQASAGRRHRRKRNSADYGSDRRLQLKELLGLKTQTCPDFVIRLNDDRVALDNYVNHAIECSIPLFLGVGASQIDRHKSIAVQDVAAMSSNYVAAIKSVTDTIKDKGYRGRVPPWPGSIYFEDISAESNLELVEAIVGTVLREGNQ
jgi:hypothetical protein